MRGRKPKPIGLKLLHGETRPSRLRTGPKPRPTAPSCPRWLDSDAKAFWRAHAGQMESLGLLTQLDGAGFAMVCLMFSAVKRLAEDIEANGRTQTNAKGISQPRPEVRMHAQAADQLRAWLSEFGLTPTSRTRLGANIRQPRDHSDLDDLLDPDSHGRHGIAKYLTV